MSMRLLRATVPACLLLLAGCGDAPAPATPTPSDPHAGHDHGSAAGIALPAAVQHNLGITWAKAEYRVIQGVLRLPARYEAEPSARRAYQASVAGQVEVLVQPYQRVAAGDALYRIEAPAWRDLQRQLADATAANAMAAERLAAARSHVAALESAQVMLGQRLAAIDQLGNAIGERAAERTEAATRVAELAVDLAAARTEATHASSEAIGADGHPACGLAATRLRLLLRTAATLSGESVEALTAATGHGVPHWQELEHITVRATAPGVVEGEIATSGTWLDDHATVLTVIDPAGVRVRANALQADLPRLRDGMPARIVGVDPQQQVGIPATVVLSPVADAVDRSVELIARPAPGATLPVNVRPGVLALLEVVVAGNADEELAIPVAATIRDGLKTLIFRRDPAQPERVQQLEADLGASDGRWVAVLSGLKEGDQVVLGGIYPLKLSQQGGAAQAGHFDPDGTFHTGKH